MTTFQHRLEDMNEHQLAELQSFRDENAPPDPKLKALFAHMPDEALLKVIATIFPDHPLLPKPIQCKQSPPSSSS